MPSYIDTKYVNRSFIDIDVKNLNSKYSKKTSNYLRLFYLRSFKFLLQTFNAKSITE